MSHDDFDALDVERAYDNLDKAREEVATLRARVAELEAQLATAPAAPQSTPNGWKVGAETVELFKRSYDNVKHMTAEHDVAIRAALRERTPHLLRDLADGVSDGQLRLSLDRATGGSDNLGVALLRNCLRTLADTLEGEA